jgi:hypothetical protein
MGRRNAETAIVLWAELPPLPKLLLVCMAVRSLDPPGKDGKPHSVYFGGFDDLMLISGRSRSATFAAVKALREMGALEQMEFGHVGTRASFRLLLDPLTVRKKGSGKQDPKGSGKQDKRVRETGLEGPGNGTPKGTQDDEENGEENNSPDPAISPAPVDNSANPEFDEMTEEQARRALTERHGLVYAVHLLEKHANADPDCDNPAGHLLAGSPSFTVIPGGKSA